MVDELNTPQHRWNQPQYNVALAKTDFSASTIFDSGIQKIDARVAKVVSDYAASLFTAAGARGFAFFPADWTTLFQDVNALTPVTATGQSVGLMLDKSQALARGPELITNGDFSNGLTGWTDASTAPSTVAVVGGVATWQTDGVNNGRIRQSFTTVIGKTYRVTATGFAAPIAIGTTSGGQEILPFVAVQTRPSFVFVATATTIWLNTATNINGATLDNVSVTELAGNHATQATPANAPVSCILPSVGVRNRANGSADVGNATIWRPTTQNGITTTRVGSGFDTDGLPYVDVRYQGTATNTVHDQIYLTTEASQSATSGQSYTASLIARVIAGSTANVAGLLVRTAEFTAPSTFVGIALGAAVTASTDTVTTATRAITTGNLLVASIALTFTNGATIDVTYRIKALQFELGSSRTNYQYNYSQYNVTEAPFASVRGIQFDGVDDWLQTAAVDFSNSDEVTVVAGVRKLSDAARSIVVELGISAVSGAFLIDAPGTTPASQRYRFASVGTTAAVPETAVGPAPDTAIISGQGKISTDIAILRRNGAQVGSAPNDQGTGNYANAIVYIGRRGGASLPFNGVITALVGINRLLSAAELANLERDVNDLMRAY